MFFLIIKINDWWGDFSVISAETATLAVGMSPDNPSGWSAYHVQELQKSRGNMQFAMQHQGLGANAASPKTMPTPSMPAMPQASSPVPASVVPPVTTAGLPPPQSTGLPAPVSQPATSISGNLTNCVLTGI